jgi:hypothetical protein
LAAYVDGRHHEQSAMYEPADLNGLPG